MGWRRALVVVLLAGCAGAPRAPLVLHGARSDPGHPAVAFLSSGCSGTLIAERWVLTAAHCVEEPAALPRVRFVGPGFRFGARTFSRHVHPHAYVDGRLDRAHDMAILELDRPVPRGVARPVSVLLNPLSDREALPWWYSRPVRLVGWHQSPPRIGVPERYAGWNLIAGVERRGVFVTRPPRDEPGGGFRTRFGDSGGPAIVMTDRRDWIVGVLSGKPAASSPESVYAATFQADNGVWIGGVLGADLPEDPPMPPALWP